MTPKPISTTPQEDDKPLPLFCPDQDGWHTGVWSRGKWLAYIDTSVVLEPSHWLSAPPLIHQTPSDRPPLSHLRSSHHLRTGLHPTSVKRKPSAVPPR
jgi:hypothetical protein